MNVESNSEHKQEASDVLGDIFPLYTQRGVI